MLGLAGHNHDTRCYGWGLDPRVNRLGRSPQFFSECFLCCDSCEFRMPSGGESSLLLSSPPYDYGPFLCWWGQSYKRTRQALSAAESHFTDMVSEVALCCQADGLQYGTWGKPQDGVWVSPDGSGVRNRSACTGCSRLIEYAWGIPQCTWRPSACFQKEKDTLAIHHYLCNLKVPWQSH